MIFHNDDISNNTLISAGSVFKGTLDINGFLRIDGDVDGDIKTNGNVIISEHARIKGNITAVSIIIGGIVQGNIIAPESVLMLSTSAVIGNIQTHRVEIEQHGIFHGHCISLVNTEIYDTAVQNYEDEETVRSRAFFASLSTDEKDI